MLGDAPGQDAGNVAAIAVQLWRSLALQLISIVGENDFRESPYRMISVLMDMGVTILVTAKLEDRYADLRFSSYGNAFLADAIGLQRYAEIDGEFRRVMSVVKVRGSAHSKGIRFFDIADDTLTISESLLNFQGILSAHPSKRERVDRLKQDNGNDR